MHNFRELDVWKKAINVTTLYYKVSKSYPKDEIFGLTSQSRRSLVSISSNIAEGAGRNNVKEFIQFLGIASGSAYELETQLILLFGLNFKQEIEITPLTNELAEIQKMIYSFKTKLNNG